MASAPKNIVRFSSTQVVPPVTQTELQLLLSLRGRVKQLQDQITSAEASLAARLQSGATIEPGDHAAQVKEHSRRNVAWKAVVIRLASRLRMDGQAYCNRVIASTNPTKSVALIVN